MRPYKILLTLSALLLFSCESPVTDNPVEKKQKQHALLGTWGNLLNSSGEVLYKGFCFTPDSLIDYEAYATADGPEIYKLSYSCEITDSTIILDTDTMFYVIRNDSLYVKDFGFEAPLIKGITPENVDYDNFNHQFEESDLTQEQLTDQDGNRWSFAAPDSEWGQIYIIEGAVSENGTWEYSRESGIITLTTNNSQISRYRAVFVKDHIVFESSDGGSDITLRY